MDNMFEEEEANDGDQFMAVKPWVGQVKASIPSNYKPSKSDNEKP